MALSGDVEQLLVWRVEVAAENAAASAEGTHAMTALPFAPPPLPALPFPDSPLWARLVLPALPAREWAIPLDPARRARARGSLHAWIRAYRPHWRAPNAFQREMAESIQQRTLSKFAGTQRQAVAGPRGGGKTSIVTEGILWAALNKHARFLVLLAANGEKAKDGLARVARRIETDLLLLEDFPEICQPIRAFGGDPRRAPHGFEWSARKLVLPNGVCVVAHGLDAPLAGMLNNDDRVDWILVDDAETTASVSSEAETNALRLRMTDVEGLVAQGLSASATLIWLCTLKAPECLSAEYTDAALHPSWRGIRVGAVAEFPAREDLWRGYMYLIRPVGEAPAQVDLSTGATHSDADTCAALGLTPEQFAAFVPATQRAFRFYAAQKAEMDRGARVLDPELLPLWFIYHDRATKGERFFWCEYQQRPPREDRAQPLDLAKLDARRMPSPSWTMADGRLCGVPPAWAAHVFASIDIGLHVIYAQLSAWSADLLTSRVILADTWYTNVNVDGRYAKAAEADRPLLGTQGILAVLTRMRDLFAHGVPRDTGEMLPVRLIGMDAGGPADQWAHMEEVISFAVRSPNWLALKGQAWTDALAKGAVGRHWLQIRAEARDVSRSGATYPLILVDTDWYKSLAYEALQRPLVKADMPLLPFAGTCQLSPYVFGDYCQHLKSEIRLSDGKWYRTARDGQPVIRRGEGSAHGVPNHGWDTAVQQFVLADIARVHLGNAVPRRAPVAARPSGSAPSHYAAEMG